MKKRKIDFTYKTLDVVFKEFKEQKDVFAQLDYAKQLKADASCRRPKKYKNIKC